MNTANTKLIRDFRKILREFERELFFQNVSACCQGVSLPQCHALLEIEDQQEISITELADKLKLEKSTVSRTIDSLVKKGYILREIPSDNRRTTKLMLTHEGTSTCDNINWNNDEYISKTLNCLTEKEKAEFIRLFEKITKQLIQIREKTKQCM